jgi:putative phage-type endonuclease
MENTTANRIEILNELQSRPVIKQRTSEWFEVRKNMLTASDLYDAVFHPASLIKKKLKNVSFNSYSIPALKWGCMFEPMATRIYANMKNTIVYEFGLLSNNNIANFGASPDGITNEGIMIEIKCPYSREIIDKVIPEKYNYQMQGQMAVCELDICDYIECKFICFNNKNEYIENVKDLDDNYIHGIIAEFKDDEPDKKWIYSAENQTYMENISEMETNHKPMKFIYWKLDLINIQRIYFDKNEWNNTEKKIAEYWILYQKALINNKPINLFIEDND